MDQVMARPLTVCGLTREKVRGPLAGKITSGAEDRDSDDMHPVMAIWRLFGFDDDVDIRMAVLLSTSVGDWSPILNECHSSCSFFILSKQTMRARKTDIDSDNDG